MISKFSTFLFFFIILFSIAPQEVSAQTCTGSYTSTGLANCVYNGMQAEYSCGRSYSETSNCGWTTYGCRATVLRNEGCSIDNIAVTCVTRNMIDGITNNGCSVIYPTSPPGPTSPPANTPTSPPGATCSVITDEYPECCGDGLAREVDVVSWSNGAGVCRIDRGPCIHSAPSCGNPVPTAPPGPTAPPPPTATPVPGCESCTSWETHSCGDFPCGSGERRYTCASGAPAWCTQCRSECSAGPTSTPPPGVTLPPPSPTPTIVIRYSISGNIFIDTDNDTIKDVGESNYTAGSITVTSVNTSGTPTGTITYSAGQYDVSNLLPGRYTVRYTSLPTGYRMIYPLNGPPPYFVVTVGPVCFVPDATTGASCTGLGNVQTLDFAISNSGPWIQTIGLDIRKDAGYTNFIPQPSTAACYGAYGTAAGTFGTHGVTFIGNTDGTFGLGQASQNNWTVGGSQYPSLYSNTGAELPTSYSNILLAAQKNELSITNIASIPGCNSLINCQLPNTLAEGIYQANGNLTLTGTTRFQNERNIVILVNGSLRVWGDIVVPQSSTAIFSALESIEIANGVGSAPSCGLDTDIQGFFSAGRDFIVQGVGDCRSGPDQMLKVEGTVVANARRAGGALLNWRDLCADNARYPSIRIIARPDFILNMPNFLRRSNLIYRELAP